MKAILVKGNIIEIGGSKGIVLNADCCNLCLESLRHREATGTETRQTQAAEIAVSGR